MFVLRNLCYNDTLNTNYVQYCKILIYYVKYIQNHLHQD